MLYGLIGEKLGHSLSKPIHEKLADYNYEIHPLTREEFKTFMEAKEFRAINVTIPYKIDVIPYLDNIDDYARAIGAVNTIVNRNGKLRGYNTDFTGFEYMIIHHNVDLNDKKCIVLGNGGAAQAIKAVLRKYKAKEIVTVDIIESDDTISIDECYANHTDADVIVNTSPVGMYPDNDSSPIDLTTFEKCTTVLDVVYNPLPTKLVKQALDLGKQGINGLEMLVAQAKYAVEIFLDTPIDERKIDELYNEIKNDFLNN